MGIASGNLRWLMNPRTLRVALLTCAVVAVLVPLVVFVMIGVMAFIEGGDDELRAFAESLRRADPKIVLSLIYAVFGVFVAVSVGLIFRNLIVGLQRESKEYARKISGRQTSGLTVSAEIGPLGISVSSRTNKLRSTIKELREQLAVIKEAPISVDTSNPDKLFQAARQRLLDEAVRIDSISRRNLIIGILFSVIALAVLAWPLIAAAFQTVDANQRFDVWIWAAQYYLPRFAVGLLLQFVGFFFLRLYVANELDLKHNKNEITNVEMKMMGVQLAQAFNDTASKKEIMKSLSNTERNFLIKKNEKTTSTEALAEYNDMKSLFEKLIDKIPGNKGK